MAFRAHDLTLPSFSGLISYHTSPTCNGPWTVVKPSGTSSTLMPARLCCCLCPTTICWNPPNLSKTFRRAVSPQWRRHLYSPSHPSHWQFCPWYQFVHLLNYVLSYTLFLHLTFTIRRQNTRTGYFLLTPEHRERGSQTQMSAEARHKVRDMCVISLLGLP